MADFKQGWEIFQRGITKLKGVLEGSEPQFTSEECAMLSTTIYNMCIRSKCDIPEELYESRHYTFEEYITVSALPSLRERHDDEFVLRELVTSWYNYKLMIQWFARVFASLERCLRSVEEVAIRGFQDLVYSEFKIKARDAVISLINQERDVVVYLIDREWDGDRTLLKNVLDIFVEIGMGTMNYYENNFETTMLENTTNYYSWVADCWIEVDSCPTFLLKAENYFKT